MSNNGPARMDPDDRRDQIVRVAVDHFARHGYDKASITRIAHEAGVTRALVYHYFPGKEPLFEAVLRREAQTLLAATEPDPRATPRQNVQRALDAYLTHFGAAGGALRTLYSPHPAAPAVVGDLAAANHAVQVGWLREHLGLDDDPRTRLALSAWLAFVEQTARGAAGSPDLDRAEVVALCLTTLEAAVGRSVL
jgi:AcrR family transcriptional regulator